MTQALGDTSGLGDMTERDAETRQREERGLL